MENVGKIKIKRENITRKHTGEIVLKPNLEIQETWLPVIQNLAKEGKTIKDIALVLGFKNSKPLQEIIDKVPNFSEAFQSGCNMAKAGLILSLFQCAMGYTYMEEVVEYKLNKLPNGRVEEVPFRKTVRPKHVPANPKMAIFLAKNYMAEDFKEVTEVETKELKVQVLAELEKDKIKEFAGNLVKYIESKEVNNAD